SEQHPVSLLKVSHGFEGIAGEGGVRAAEAYCHQPAPQWIGQDPLRGPGDKETQKQASANVDEKGPVGKSGVGKSGNDFAEQIAEVSADNCAYRYPGIGFPFDQSSHSQ